LVYDANTLELKKAIEDKRLVTPTGKFKGNKYNGGHLLRLP